ncbi:putative ATPase [Sorochytrium milnesiophthora]
MTDSATFDTKADIIPLNIGGTQFEVRRGTLLWPKSSSNFFKLLLDGDNTVKLDKTGSIFIDRSPRVFDVVLQYLRTTKVIIPPTVAEAEVREEAEYFGLSDAMFPPPEALPPPVTEVKEPEPEPKYKSVVENVRVALEKDEDSTRRATATLVLSSTKWESLHIQSVVFGYSGSNTARISCGKIKLGRTLSPRKDPSYRFTVVDFSAPPEFQDRVWPIKLESDWRHGQSLQHHLDFVVYYSMRKCPPYLVLEIEYRTLEDTCDVMVVSDKELRLQQLNKLLEHSATYAQIIASRFEEERERVKAQQERKAKRDLKLAQAASSLENGHLQTAAGSAEHVSSADLSSPGSKRPQRAAKTNGAEATTAVLKTDKKRKRQAAAENGASTQDSPSKKPRETSAGDAATAQALEPENQDALRDLRIDAIFRGTLRQYQIDGIRWIDTLYSNGLNGILGDEMGLGKTVQTIGFLSRLRAFKAWGYFLVVAPLSTIDNWRNEFIKFAPSIPTVLYHGSQVERLELQKDIRKQEKKGDRFTRPVIITSYEIVTRDAHFFQTIPDGFKFMVVDEGHRLKNRNCQLIRTLKSFRSENRILLTGTPLQNDLSELWSLLNFLIPEIFDDVDRFLAWFDFSVSGTALNKQQILMQEEQEALVSKMHAILQPFMLRRVKADVTLDLPQKKEFVVYTRLTAQQIALYEAIKQNRLIGYLHTLHGLEDESKAPAKPLDKKARRTVVSSYEELTNDQFFDALEESPHKLSELYDISEAAAKRNIGNTKVRTSVNNKIMNLRKACMHPYMFPHPERTTSSKDPTAIPPPTETLVRSSGKMLLLDQLLHALFAQNHKVLIFSQMTTMLDILEDYMVLRDWSYCRLDGSMAQVDRREAIQVFNEDPMYRVFLLSTRAGGLGINLTAADTVIIFDSDWNPQQDLQAQDRVHRIGQTKPVLVLRLISENSVEEIVFDRAQAKRQLEKMVIQHGSFSNPTQRARVGQQDSARLVDILAGVLEEVDGQQVRGLEGEDEQLDENGAPIVISDRDLHNLLDRSKMVSLPGSRNASASPVATSNEPDGAQPLAIEDVDEELEEARLAKAEHAHVAFIQLQEE